MNKTDLAWAAGIIDGEGCIYIARHKKGGANGLLTDSYHVAIKVTMCHEPTVLRMRKIFGKVGSSHRISHAKEGHNTAYSWLAQAKIAKDVLLKVKPYLFTKKKESEVALKFMNRPRWYGGQFRGPKSKKYQEMEYKLWDKMRRLKSRTLLKLNKLEKI